MSGPVNGSRGRLTSVEVSRAEQDGELLGGEILGDLQAAIPAGPDYLEPMFQTLLDGLRPPETRKTSP
ncbi:MAG: hypothetical protein ACLP50_31480 [Solirubrobacteraceae bacterium]